MQPIRFAALAAITVVFTGALGADPIKPGMDDKGGVRWFPKGDPRQVAPNTKPIKDQVPAYGKLEFAWTMNDKDHPDFGIYKEPAEGAFTTGGTRYFYQPRPLDAERQITDWRQKVVDADGTSHVKAGNIKRNSPWQFHPLADLGSIGYRIPDLAPMNAADPNTTIYTAVNLGLYHASNPLGFLNGQYSIRQTLDELGLQIRDGKMAGVQGIYWSLTPFDFDPDSETGWVPSGGPGNWLNYGGTSLLGAAASNGNLGYTIGINGIHDTVPEPSCFALVGIGVALIAMRVRRRSSC